MTVTETTYAPPVTAVVPTHARPELMKLAVESILAQEYAGPIEVIVVFDACDPVLPEVELGEQQTLRGVVNERSRGLAGARNTGILAATHDFVAFLDDDDMWLPEKLAAQMQVFAEHPDANLVGTAIEVDNGHATHERLVIDGPVTHELLLHDRFAGLHSSSFVFRKDHLIELGMIDEELPGSYGEDYDVLLQTATYAPVRVVNRPLVTVRWQGQSFFFGRWGQYAEALQYLLRRHPEFANHRKALSRVQSQVAFGLAADGQRKEGLRWAARSLRGNPRAVKAWLAAAIALRLTTANAVASVAQRFGRGI